MVKAEKGRAGSVILKCAAIGAVLCGGIMFFFGDGWLMALYTTAEGVLFGSFVGGIFGWIISSGARGSSN